MPLTAEQLTAHGPFGARARAGTFLNTTSAWGSGGAVAVLYGAAADITNCTVTNATAQNGAACPTVQSLRGLLGCRNLRAGDLAVDA